MNCTYWLNPSYLITSRSSHKIWDSYLFDGLQFNLNLENIAETNEITAGGFVETPTFGAIGFTNEGIVNVRSDVLDAFTVGDVNISETKFKDTIEIGDSWFNTCTWDAHHETFTLENDNTYQDVLELSCGEKVFYFSNGNGNIAMEYVENDFRYKYLVSNITLGDLNFGYLLNTFGEDILRLF